MPTPSSKKLNWVTTLFFILTPMVGVSGTLYVILTHSLHWLTLVLALFYIFAAGMSITAGYHRLFSHLTYKGLWPIRLFYILFGAAAFEGSVLEWCTDHRNHHRYTDQEKDPYSVKKGLWHAHIGWLLYLDESKRNYANVTDLAKDPLIAWQHKYYNYIAGFMCFILPALIAASWGDAVGGFFIAGALRVSLNHHFTFCINSVCHYIGKKTYANLSARDNWIMSLFTYGEGFHNFHHQFAADYRNGIRWFHFDPSKWLIWCLSKLHLTSHLKKFDHELVIQHRLKMEEQLVKIGNHALRTQTQTLVNSLLSKLNVIYLQLVKLRQEHALLKADKKTLLKNQYRIYSKACKDKISLCKKEFNLVLNDLIYTRKRAISL